MKELDEVDKVKMRVGAPAHEQPNGYYQLEYKWINKRIWKLTGHPSNYEHKKAQPDGYETIMVDGDRYEDPTPGGASSMCKLPLVK